MQNWKKDFLSFWNNRIYVLLLSLTALCSYGFLITHHTVGIDDTPYTYYFEEGLNVIVGRWFMYLLNKVFHVADFAPFITDLAGVLILMVAVTVWCTLIYGICKESIPRWGYLFFACIFLSCPLISEVYTYYLHNGVSFGYLFVGVSLCFFKELADIVGRWESKRPVFGKYFFLCAAGTSFFLFAAMGCYESFMIVWLVGLLAVLLLKRYMGQPCRIFLSLAGGACLAVVAILLRSVMITACVAIFDLGAMQDEAVQRSIGEMLGWMFESGAGAEFAMAIKRMYVMYFVFAYAYYPIKIFVWATIVLVLYGIWSSIRRRDVWIIVLTVGMFIAAFLLVVIEGNATLYRAAQFLPVICGFGALILCYAIGRLKGKNTLYRVTSGVTVFALCAVLWNQCYDMNRWFYVDWMKYESAKETMLQVSEELERNFDTSKPVVFMGIYQIPQGITRDAYVEYNSELYFKMKRLTDIVDEDLLDKFNRGNYGVWIAQTPALSVIDWGMYAFDSDAELVRFMTMHGWEVTLNEDLELIERVRGIAEDLPEFPKEGSIVDMGEYIIVHF